MIKPSVTIGIPAYNEANNIGLLLGNILSQKTISYFIKEIIISSDGSTDLTVSISKTFKDKRIIVIDNRNRKGKTRGLNQILSRASGDILLFLDADIRISDYKFIHKLITPIIRKKADLTTSLIRPLPPKTRIAKILYVSMLLKYKLFETYKHGTNIYTCFGPAQALSRRFYKSLRYPQIAGNDQYSYLACLSKHFTYINVKESVVYYQLPNSFADHQKQSLRFFKSFTDHKKYFPIDLVKAEMAIPPSVYIKSGIRSLPILIKYPFYSVAYFLIQFYIKVKANYINPITDKWDIAISSKKLV